MPKERHFIGHCKKRKSARELATSIGEPSQIRAPENKGNLGEKSCQFILKVKLTAPLSMYVQGPIHFFFRKATLLKKKSFRCKHNM